MRPAPALLALALCARGPVPDAPPLDESPNGTAAYPEALMRRTLCSSSSSQGVTR